MAAGELAAARANNGAASSSTSPRTTNGEKLERPMEPVLLNGKGMRVLGFMPLGGFKALGRKAGHGGDAEPPTPASGGRPEAAQQVASGESAKDDSNVKEASEVGAAAADKNAADAKKHHDGYKRRHGSYRHYYSYRHGPDGSALNGLDRRLDAILDKLGKDFFDGKEVLDVGCNAGAVSLMVAKKLQAKRVVGMELDTNLVRAAKEAAAREAPTADLEFREEDILTCPLKRPPDNLPERFDIVMCLSVTKWVHFAHGDAGIRSLFKRCLKRLRPGGYFVLEPQEWSSYRKKMHLTAEIRQNVKDIELRPAQFREALEELGFVHHGTIAPPDTGPKGFQRSLQVYAKPDCEAAEVEAAVPPPASVETKKRKRSADEVEDAASDPKAAKCADEKVEEEGQSKRARKARRIAEEDGKGSVDNKKAKKETEDASGQALPKQAKVKASKKKKGDNLET